MKKIYSLLTLTLLTLTTFAQTYNGGQWYALYDTNEKSHGQAWAADWEYDVFAPTTGVLTFDWKKTGWLVRYPILTINAYESADGGNSYSNALVTISSGTGEKQDSYISSGNVPVSTNINKLKMEIASGSLTRYFTNVIIPLAKHIRFDSGEYGTTAAQSNDFGSLLWGETSEPYRVNLRSFYTNGDITVTSSIPQVFRIGSADNTNGLTYAVGANACASKNGSGNAGGSKLGNIANYNFDIYFCPQEGIPYSGTVTISDGVNSLTINVSGTGLKKDQSLTWEQPEGEFLSNVTLAPAAASSALPVAYTFDPEGILTAAEGALAIQGTGTVTATASQPGSTKYHAATPITKTFVIHPAVTYSTLEGYVCPGSELDFLGQPYPAGEHQIQLPNTWGGDSIITLTVHEHPVYHFTEEHTICAGDTYEWHNRLLSDADTYYDSLTTVNGCDSIFVLTLSHYPVYTDIQDGATICPAELPYTWETITFTEAGSETLTLRTIHNCDSVVTFTLNVLSAYDLEPEHAVVCPGDSIEWNGRFYKEPGEYTFPGKTAAGCDSIAHLVLTLLPTYNEVISEDKVYGDVIEWHGEQIALLPGERIFMDSLRSEAGCDSIITYIYTVAKAPQTINFSLDSLTYFVGDSIAPVATATSGLDVVIMLDEGAAAFWMNDSTIYLSAEGEVVLTALQQGNDYYLPAEPVVLSLTVAPAPETPETPDTPVVPTGCSPVYGDSEPTQKLLHNGHVIILRGSNSYDLLGRKLQ